MAKTAKGEIHFSDKLLQMLEKEIVSMLQENRNQGIIEYFPGFTLNIGIDNKPNNVVMKIPVKEFITDEENIKFIYIGKNK
jgi:hypothetical protein